MTGLIWTRRRGNAHLDAHALNLVFLSYPNNPTGTNFSAEVIREMLSRPDTLVLLDEALLRILRSVPYGGTAALPPI